MEGWNTVYESGRTPLWANPRWFLNHKAAACSYLCWVRLDLSVPGVVQPVMSTPVVVHEVPRGGKLLVMVEIDGHLGRAIRPPLDVKLTTQSTDGMRMRWFVEVSPSYGAPTLEKELWNGITAGLSTSDPTSTFRIYHPEHPEWADLDVKIEVVNL